MIGTYRDIGALCRHVWGVRLRLYGDSNGKKVEYEMGAGTT